ncbi:hypothetical protein LCGC14_0636190 [marine sediment metagenome]|uniref:Uncharacterized protein n=1 Tax=marine sediment metagenome TaxID=412755 RepID=A0A0F9TM08_9ZZZZ|nr:hypothetical protein [bacterium]
MVDNKNIGNVLIAAIIVISIIVAFTGLIRGAFFDLGLILPIGILFSVVLILIFSVACFLTIKRAIQGKN